ncbi:hypothetical protein EVAR_91193_1 [Eumeta japonica]|uniref:Uncharacterized protein n=1 Tax=Eumeta variegata TaxID=151549 RepID=A0A4C1ZHC5_EUMVA|nr:hypothetical protein EVAR_91193_1 [Eumeta japonica]
MQLSYFLISIPSRTVAGVAVVVASFLHPATGAGAGVSLWLVPGLHLGRDTALLGHDKATYSQSYGGQVGADRHALLITCRQAPFRCCVGRTAESRVRSITLCSGVFAGVADEPPASARASSRMRKNRQVEGAPGMRISTRRGRAGGSGPGRARRLPPSYG